MVITFVCDVLGEPNNGTTIATLHVAEAMRKRGHEVRFIVPDQDKKGAIGFTVVKPINFLIFNNYVKHNGVCLATSRPRKDVDAALKGSDVIHFNFCGALSAYAVKYARRNGIPCTASLHSQAENFTSHVFLMGCPVCNYALYRIINTRLFKKVDAVHYPSAFIRDLFRKTTHNKVKPYVISNGISGEFKRIPVERDPKYDGKILVGYTARYSAEKYHEILFKALKYSKYADKIVYVFAGAGPHEKKFRRMAKRYCKNEPIFGFHAREEMVKLLNSLDLYVHPSLIDIEPISAIEALSVGATPVLTDSKKSAVSSFAIDQRNVFKHNSPKDLAAKMDYWLDHPEEARENGEKYVGCSERFDFETSMNKMESMFLEVIANKKHKNEA